MTERDIQNSLYRFCNRRGDKVFAPNFHLRWETDFISVTRDFKVCAYEIKVSRADFRNDFAHKKEKHEAYKTRTPRSFVPNRFYYVTPEGLIRPDEVPNYAGLLWVRPFPAGSHNPFVPTSTKKAPCLHSEPASKELMLRISVSLMHRYWRLRIRKG